VLLAALVLAAGCGDATEPTAAAPADLAGTAWVQAGWDTDGQAMVFRRTDRLAGEVVGYAFGEDGALVYRSFGWCATPPLTYFDVEGVWERLDGGRIRVTHPLVLPEGTVCYEIVALTADELKLRECAAAADAPPAADPLQGRWEGTYTIVHDYGAPTAVKETGDVTFVVAGDKFRVTGDRPRLPPDAAGPVTVGDEVVLVDELFHTADYDWTLNVDGPFTYAVGAGTLVLEQHDAVRKRLRTFILQRVVGE
jgi:hypothetical protein